MRENKGKGEKKSRMNKETKGGNKRQTKDEMKKKKVRVRN